ncbi:MAG TPA: (2Fe-2S) ferredoxin domain-containing protein [Haloplasmataceae bacterium]
MKKTLADLEKIREETLKRMQVREHNDDIRIVVGMGTCGISAGARECLTAIIDEVEKRGLNNVQIVQTGCIGLCRLEPMFDVYIGDKKYTYVNMTKEKSRQVVVEHIVNNRVIKEYTISSVENE